MKKMRQSWLATFMHNLKFAIGIGCISILFITAAQCNKAEELVGPSPEPATPELIYEGDSIVYMKAWDTLKPQKFLVTKDTTKSIKKPLVQKPKKKKVVKVVKKKKHLSAQDRENVEFEKWYRKTHKK